MKKFFTNLMEILTTIALSSCLIFILFKYVIGTPEDIKTLGSKVNVIKETVDTIKNKQLINSEILDAIENTQFDLSQRIHNNNFLLKENSDQLEEIKRTNREILKSIKSEK